MFLHEMTVSERLESIVHIASKLAGAPAHAAFVTEWPDLVIGCRGGVRPGSPEPYAVLHVTAPGQPANEWKLGTPGEQGRAEGTLTYTMLLSLAHEADVCPRCHAAMPRTAKPSERGLRCYSCSCGMQVRERL